MDELVKLIVAALATWRLSSLLVYERGPFGVFMHLRTFGQRWNFTAELLSCVWCASVWVGAVFALVLYFGGYIWLLPLALSAAAIAAEQVIKKVQ